MVFSRMLSIASERVCTCEMSLRRLRGDWDWERWAPIGHQFSRRRGVEPHQETAAPHKSPANQMAERRGNRTHPGRGRRPTAVLEFWNRIRTTSAERHQELSTAESQNAIGAENHLRHSAAFMWGSGYVLPALSADIARQVAYVVRGKHHLILGRT
jgi:hypothetical protein